MLPTFASAELWGAVEPPVPGAGAKGSDCFSVGFRTAEIHGLRFGVFEAAAMLASSDGAAAVGLAWGCFSAMDFNPNIPPMMPG